MILQPIFDLKTEVNRLFIAGSKFSKDDPRLAKQIPIFKKMGEKVPVFNKIATDIENLLKAPSNESAFYLMELSNILYAVLNTQTDTMIEGKITKTRSFFSLQEVNTTHSYLTLQAVEEALRKPNSGRLEILKDALEQGVFKDVRLFSYIDGALDDKYSELADFVAEKVIPSIGSMIEPYICHHFELEDKSSNVRRFKCLIALKSPVIDDLIKQIFEQSLPNLQAAAIEYLKTDKSNEEFITQLTEDKNKIVRKAAYDALRSMKTPSAIKKLISLFEKTFKKGNTDLYETISLIEDTSQVDVLLKYLKEDVVKINELEDVKEIGKAAEKFCSAIEVLFHKKDKSVTDFIFELISNVSFFEHVTKGKASYNNVAENIATRIFLIIDSWEEPVPFYEKIIPLKKHKVVEAHVYDRYTNVGFKFYSEEQFYSIFQSLYLDDTINFYRVTEHDHSEESFVPYAFKWGKKLNLKWRPLIEKKIQSTKKFDYDNQRDSLILGLLVGKEDKEYSKFLLNLFQTVDIDISYEFMEPLLKMNVPNIHEIIYERIKNLNWKKNSYYRLTYDECWKHFPKEYGEKFEKLSKESNTGQIGLIAERIKEQYEDANLMQN